MTEQESNNYIKALDQKDAEALLNRAISFLAQRIESEQRDQRPTASLEDSEALP